MNSVNLVNKRALGFNKSCAERLRALFEPLCSYMGLSHFAYNRFIDGDRYISLNMDVQALEAFFINQYDQYFFDWPFYLPLNSKHVVIWDSVKKGPLIEHMERFGYGHGISIYFRQATMVEAWHFAADKDHPNLALYLSENIKLLEEFILYFQDQFKDLLDSENDDLWALYSGNKEIKLDLFDRHEAVDPLINKFRPSRFQFTTSKGRVYLSAMEFACLKGISEGQVAKIIAREQNLSPRTVETYLTRIRDKLEVCSKSQLVDEYRKSIYFHLGK